MSTAKNQLKGFFRKTRPGRKLVEKLTPTFQIANVSGNLAPSTGWGTSPKNAHKISTDGLGRTVIKASGSATRYIVGSGTDRDFTNLSKSSGIVCSGQNTVEVSSKFTFEGAIRAQLILLEFDKKRKRVGEISLQSNSRAKAKLSDHTVHILPTIRLVGEGSVTIDWLRLEASSDQLDAKKGRVQLLDDTLPSPQLIEIKSSLTKISQRAEELASEVDRLPIFGHTTASSNQLTKHSHDALAISASRELLAHDFLLALAESLPVSNGSHHFSKIDAHIGIITDEYMFNFYRDAFKKVTYLSPSNFADVFETDAVDAIVYVTCWKGLANDEWKGIKYREAPSRALNEILQYAKLNNVPTIFQSIEDPSNFEYFLPIAEKFDYVFTSDTDMLEEYRKAVGHDSVFYGEYGANPSINNPVGSYRFDINRAFFAGSYPQRYLERCADMEMIFDSIPDRDKHLVILDRNYYSDGYDFPDRYSPSIIGPVPHDVLQKIHKLFRYSLNFNSIKASPTMCAMRVYELQAQGAPLISNYARSVFNKFPNVRIVAHQTELDELKKKTLEVEEGYRANEAMVDVLRRKCSYTVVSEMMSKVGLPKSLHRPEAVLVVADDGDFEGVKSLVDKQRDIIATVISKTDIESTAFDLKKYGYVAAMSTSIPYDRNYLTSRLSAFIYTNSSFVTQLATSYDACVDIGNIHEYVSQATNPLYTVVSTDHPDWLKFVQGDLNRIEGLGYATDPFGVGFDEFVRSTSSCPEETSPSLSVIVPVYNNGRFLASKCIPSLQRNDCWSNMEVILVDDGSTDSETIEICKSLMKRHPNIEMYSFQDGGSGSASRPRNKGVEIASADLVAFLDPDNEISPHGYDNLLAEFERLNSDGSSTDFVSGYQVKVSDQTRFTGRHSTGSTLVVEDPIGRFFREGKFPVVSTQAAVLRKSMLVSNNIVFIEKAAGQDTLYGWQILLSATNPTFVDSAYIVYFAQRDDSVTNTVDISYFDKCATLEREQVRILGEYGILPFYLNKQFDNFMKNWYLVKLGLVPPENRNQATERLREIADLYGKNLDSYLEA